MLCAGDSAWQLRS
uniref:Uncharacterized protein n=1 Tax=Arundo donax TaxID=35708 RepID=A0A0A9HC50_ARUDO